MRAAVARLYAKARGLRAPNRRQVVSGIKWTARSILVVMPGGIPILLLWVAIARVHAHRRQKKELTPP